MALSLSNFLVCCGFMLPILAEAATRTYDFNIGWITTNPDGLAERTTIGINGRWPIPRIECDVGDKVIVNAYNGLGNQTTSLHFHGLYMNGTNHMDGPVGVNQCAIPINSTFVYEFTVDQPGTYWYHSHDSGQYPDGLRGPLIVHDSNSPFKNDYDEELVLTLSDWYHDDMATLIPQFIAIANPTGAEPIPDSALMNDTQNLQISVEPNKTYLIHLINIGAFAGQYFWIDGHTFDIVEVDGIYTERTTTDQIYVTVAQRYSFLLTTKNDTSSNFAITGSMDESLFDTIPATLNPNVTSYLIYNKEADLPTPLTKEVFEPFDDFTLVPYDKEGLFPDPDYRFQLDVIMNDLGDGKPYAFFNNITYVRPRVPTLYSVLSGGDLAADSLVYGGATNTHILNHMDIIEIVVNNHDTGKHPFHLHGHNFQAVVRGDDNSGDFNPDNATYPKTPMRRDTFMLRPSGHIVMRFRADNPGVWLFHCHIEWHLAQGLIATMVEAPLTIQSSLTIPSSHLSACNSLSPSVPIVGNAAGKGGNLTAIQESTTSIKSQKLLPAQNAWKDLTGQPMAPAPLPAGFTAKGIVALVFSTLAAFLGLASIIWYGMGEISEGEKRGVAERIKDCGENVEGEENVIPEK